jgi:hypothetical protein
MGIVCKSVNSRPVAESSTAADSGKLWFCTPRIIFLFQNIFIGQLDKISSGGPDGSRISAAKTGDGSRMAAELAKPSPGCRIPLSQLLW